MIINLTSEIMKTLLTILFCSIVLSIYAKSLEKKIKKVKDDYFTNIFTIDKSSKQKNGEYFKIKIHSSDTLVYGKYVNDRKTGLWKYRGAGNKDYILYNYDSHLIEYLSPSISKIDSFYIKSESEGVYLLGKVDSPPIYLGYQGEVKALFDHNVKVPVEEMARGLEGTSVASFIIDTNGKIKDVKVERSINKNFDKMMINTIKMIDSDWIPAKVNNTLTESKMLILAHVSNSIVNSNVKNKPYQIAINLNYFGIQYTQRRVSTISVPAGSRPPSF
jgi:hypothetical protein